MAVWPKSLYSFRASLQTARMSLRLRRSHAEAEQRDAFQTLIRGFAAAQAWRGAGIEPAMNYETFRARVTPHRYEQLAPYVQRMMSGETDVLWPGRCAFFTATAGTVDGRPKFIPATEEMLAHYRGAALDALLCYTARTGHAGVFRGRHLLLGGTTQLAPIGGDPEPKAYAGTLGGIATLNLPAWAEKHLFAPGAAIAQLASWEAKLDAIATRTSAEDVTLLAAVPIWALTLAAELRKRFSGNGQNLAHLQELWPNLECYVHGGAPLAPYHAELRATLGPDVNFHEVYASAEGLVAAQDQDALSGLRVLSNRGLFFEFLPMADFDPGRLEHVGHKAVPLADVKTGIDYAVLLTTPAGFARYVLGDVVRFTSTKPPRLLKVGRTQLDLTSFGERVNDRELSEALVALCERHGWTIVNFHVAPLATASLTGQNRGRHEWWIELRPGTVVTPIGPQMAAELDAALQRLNPGYAARRKAGAIEPPFVRLVMPGVFEHWLRFHHRWGGQHKLPHCRNDRLIADELAQVTNFAPH